MIIKSHELKNEPIYINPIYADKQKIRSTHDVKMTGFVDYISIDKRYLTLKIIVTIDSEKDKINVITVNFSRFFEIILNDNEERATPFAIFHYEISDTLEKIRIFLEDNLPLQIVGIKKPLKDGIEVEKKALSIYDLLIKPSA